MPFNREQIQKAYRSLPLKLQAIVTGAESTELISEELAKSTLSSDHQIIADGEIFAAILGLQTLDEALLKIAEISTGKVEDFNALKVRLNEEIFDKYPELKRSRKPLPEQTAAQNPGSEKIQKQTETNEIKKGPIVITQETKKDVMKELAQRVQAARKGGNIQLKPQVIHNSLPMIERGEKVHDVPPMSEEEKEAIKENGKRDVPLAADPATPLVRENDAEAPAEIKVEAKEEPVPASETTLSAHIQSPAPIPPSNQPVSASVETEAIVAKVAPENKVEAPKQTAPTASKPANAHYPGGVDPYREPLS